MQKTTILDNPFFIFLVSIIITFINIILPVHFVAIFLLGFLVSILIRNIEKEYYYSTFIIIICFCFIESSHGLRFFNITLLALFLHFYIIPQLKSVLNSYNQILFITVFFFYIGLALLFYIGGSLNQELISVFIMNYIIDILFISIFL